MPNRLDFKAIAESVDIYAVAKHLGITITKDRAACPTCDSERALQFFPETNSFQCHALGDTRQSDCIALYAHVSGYEGMYKAAKELNELFSVPANAGIVHTNPNRATVPTAPQKSGGGKAKSEPAPFDPEVYAQKLTYSEMVADLGISEADAKRLSIGYASTGMHRGRVVFPIRDETGAIAGFVGWNGTDLKLPQSWLTSNVVKLKRA